MSSRDAYVEKLKAQLDEWNAELSRLEAQAGKAEGDAKIRYQKHMKDLREMRAKAQQRLTEIQEADEDAWEELKEDVGNTWNAFKEAFVRAKSEFERGYREGHEESEKNKEHL